jgi:hypothetical protein
VCGAVQLPLFISPDHHCPYYAGPVIIVVTAFTMADDETDGLTLPSFTFPVQAVKIWH